MVDVLLRPQSLLHEVSHAFHRLSGALKLLQLELGGEVHHALELVDHCQEGGAVGLEERLELGLGGGDVLEERLAQLVLALG